jgi:autotransporter translocation and assembly factor TamB
MFATDFPANTGAGEEPVKQTEEDSAQAWTAEIGNVSVGASIDWHSEFTNPPLLSISPITARASNIKWPFTGQTAVELGLSINDAAGLSVDGALALAEGSGTINYQLSDLPLPWFNPNLPAALKARISDGRLKLAGQTELQAFIPHQIQGGGDISQFSGGVEGSEASLTSWDIVRWEGLAVNLDKRELTLDKLSINDYQGRLHIQKDGSINTQKIWQEEVGEEAQELAEDLSEDGAWKINIPAIIMTDSQIDFMDESLPIPFRTVVGDLKGEIFDLSTEPGPSRGWIWRCSPPTPALTRGTPLTAGCSIWICITNLKMATWRVKTRC